MLNEIKNFYKKTKLNFKKEKEMVLPESEWPKNWIKIYSKVYPRMPHVKLSKSNPEGEFENLLESRNSIRNFSDTLIGFEDLNRVLYFSLGIKNDSNDFNKTKRFYPSAGARYPIESYLLSDNIENLQKGLYHYDVKNNKLEQLLSKDLSEECGQIFQNQKIEGKKNYLVLTSVINRSDVKYGLNAYRFSLLECGHIGQNFSLLCEKEKLGCCAIGGFDNDKLAKVLDLTEEEIPLYAFAFGSLK
jgi:SagB-type dehydrogenase family enzyme